MNRLAAFVVALSACHAATALSAETVSARVHRASDSDLIVTCTPGPTRRDYVAETASGVKLTDPYAVERGADKGLVRLMDEGGRRAKRYAVPRARIRAIVSLKVDQDMPDRVDLVFTGDRPVVVYTSTANGGVFVDSDVYRLRYRVAGGVDRSVLQGQPEMLQRLDIGLSFLDPTTHACRSAPSAGPRPAPR